MVDCNIKRKNSDESVTKRTMLHSLATIYDPLGIAGPITLKGKMLFREVCDLKIPWNQPVPSDFYKRWIKWEKSLPNHITIPRAFNMSLATIDRINIHTFADASKQGVCATLYLLIHQTNKDVHQGILSAKCRLAKKNQTTPRLKLTAAHMATKVQSCFIGCLQ